MAGGEEGGAEVGPIIIVFFVLCYSSFLGSMTTEKPFDHIVKVVR